MVDLTVAIVFGSDCSDHSVESKSQHYQQFGSLKLYDKVIDEEFQYVVLLIQVNSQLFAELSI